MAQEPISPDLMKSYRDTLKIASAPSFIDTSLPIMPVAVVAQTSTAEVAQYMRLTYGTDELEINSDGSINVEGAESTAILLYSNSTSTLGTVPAGKIWRILDIWGATDNSSDSVTGTIGAVTALRLTGTANAVTGGRNWSINACPVLTATQTITCVVSGGAWIHCSYVEKDA